MIKFHLEVPSSFWDGSNDNGTKPPIHARRREIIHCWRWQVPRIERELAERVDANFSPAQLRCTLTVRHDFFIFSTILLEAKGTCTDIHELGRLLQDLRA